MCKKTGPADSFGEEMRFAVKTALHDVEADRHRGGCAGAGAFTNATPNKSSLALFPGPVSASSTALTNVKRRERVQE